MKLRGTPKSRFHKLSVDTLKHTRLNLDQEPFGEHQNSVKIHVQRPHLGIVGSQLKLTAICFSWETGKARHHGCSLWGKQGEGIRTGGKIEEQVAASRVLICQLSAPKQHQGRTGRP